MAKYTIELNEEQEKFIQLHLTLHPLREEHKREDYPRLIIHNFINSLMKRKSEFMGIYKDKTGKEWAWV